MGEELALPACLAPVFRSLLAGRLTLLRQLVTENSLSAANRHAILGPVLLGLQMLHSYWAQTSHGQRQDPSSYLAQEGLHANQRGAHLHEMARLAAFLLLWVADQDENLHGSGRTPLGQLPYLVPPPFMSMQLARACAEHVRIAYNTLYTPFHTWDARLAANNLRQIRVLREHSGYIQTRFIVLACLDAIDAAKHNMELCNAAAPASKNWARLFRSTGQRNKVVRALAQLLLMKTRPGYLTGSWIGLRKDFWRAAQAAGPHALARWPAHDSWLYLTSDLPPRHP